MITIPSHGELPIEARDNDTYLIVIAGSGWITSNCALNGRYLEKGVTKILRKGKSIGFRTDTKSLTVEMRALTRADEEAHELRIKELLERRQQEVFDPLFDPIRAQGGVSDMLSEAEFVRAVWDLSGKSGAG